jgi:hypothetical protein
MVFSSVGNDNFVRDAQREITLTCGVPYLKWYVRQTQSRLKVSTVIRYAEGI